MASEASRGNGAKRSDRELNVSSMGRVELEREKCDGRNKKTIKNNI